MRESELATTTGIAAYQIGGHLVIGATATLPSPDYELEIAERPIDIWPPEFEVCQWQHGGITPQPLDARSVVRVFPVGGRPEYVVVGDAADGQRQVPVQDLVPPAGAAFAPPTGEVGAEGAESVGLSAKLSFDEAFANALAGLSTGASFPDELVTVSVVDITGLFGGIAGFHHLAVRVRR
jgi:hypothetical protein